MSSAFQVFHHFPAMGCELVGLQFTRWALNCGCTYRGRPAECFQVSDPWNNKQHFVSIPSTNVWLCFFSCCQSRKHWPIEYWPLVEVDQAAADFGSVETHSGVVQAGLPNVINVKLQVATAHHGQNQTEGVFGFVSIGQIHLHMKKGPWMWRASNTSTRKQNSQTCGDLTTNRLSTSSRICFSFRAMLSPFLFFTCVFSSFLQAYILPVARTWQAHTWTQKEHRQ